MNRMLMVLITGFTLTVAPVFASDSSEETGTDELNSQKTIAKVYAPTLPGEVVEEISFYLDPGDVYAFAVTCKAYYYGLNGYNCSELCSKAFSRQLAHLRGGVKLGGGFHHDVLILPKVSSWPSHLGLPFGKQMQMNHAFELNESRRLRAHLEEHDLDQSYSILLQSACMGQNLAARVLGKEILCCLKLKSGHDEMLMRDLLIDLLTRTSNDKTTKMTLLEWDMSRLACPVTGHPDIYESVQDCLNQETKYNRRSSETSSAHESHDVTHNGNGFVTHSFSSSRTTSTTTSYSSDWHNFQDFNEQPGMNFCRASEQRETLEKSVDIQSLTVNHLRGLLGQIQIHSAVSVCGEDTVPLELGMQLMDSKIQLVNKYIKSENAGAIPNLEKIGELETILTVLGLARNVFEKTQKMNPRNTWSSFINNLQRMKPEFESALDAVENVHPLANLLVFNLYKRYNCETLCVDILEKALERNLNLECLTELNEFLQYSCFTKTAEVNLVSGKETTLTFIKNVNAAKTLRKFYKYAELEMLLNPTSNDVRETYNRAVLRFLSTSGWDRYAREGFDEEAREPFLPKEWECEEVRLKAAFLSARSYILTSLKGASL